MLFSSKYLWKAGYKQKSKYLIWHILSVQDIIYIPGYQRFVVLSIIIIIIIEKMRSEIKHQI